MRITGIEIKNFKGFYGTYKIDLHKGGHNLLVYGENGSGKTSLFMALKLFFESSVKDHPFEKHQNIFIPSDAGHVKLHLRQDKHSSLVTYEWSKTVKETNDPLILEADKAKGFFDYKGLLETHFLHRGNTSVNLFYLLVETLLANSINDFTNRILADDWTEVQRTLPTRNTQKQILALEKILDKFNKGLSKKLAALKTKAAELLTRFHYEVELDFEFGGVSYHKESKRLQNKELILNVKFFNKDIPEHHLFLNEAKLSAIALSIYFASLLLNPSSRLKILALDDVLIGLDMSNRQPILDILKEEFSDYQIFLLTYDKAWYEIVKQRTQNQKWKSAEFYYSKTDEYEIPIYHDEKAYLDKAKEYFQANDYKACVIYLRTAFEMRIRKFCDKKKLRVKYQENPKRLQSEDFWEPIKNEKNPDGTPRYLTETLINEIELYRSLNPLSHSQTVAIVKQEIDDAISAVEKLETELNNVN
jgi:DNA repair exonuclease SbcCD ATPase subunit